MGKSLVSQVKAVWAASRILQPGRSRFRDKVAARDNLHRDGVGATSTRIAEHTPIASYRTYDVYKSVTREFARFAKRLGVRQVRDLRPEHAEAFMLSKLDAGRSCNTLRTYSAALGKLDVALSMAPRAMRISAEARLSPGLDAVRARCHALAPRMDTGRRAYANPQGLVRAVSGDGFRLVARLQLEGGLRVSDALNVGRGDLAGETVDPVTRRWSGLVAVTGNPRRAKHCSGLSRRRRQRPPQPPGPCSGSRQNTSTGARTARARARMKRKSTASACCSHM